MNMKKLFLYNLILGLFVSCSTHQPSDEIPLLSNAGNDASCVFLTNDDSGNPVVSWAETDSAGGKYFYFSFWNGAEGRFDEKMNIPFPQNTSIHDEGMPKIAFKADGTMIATFETSVPVPGSKWGKGDIEYSTSADRGKTWTKPASVQAAYPYEGSINYSGIVRLDDGELGMAWLGTNTGGVAGRPVLFAKTTSEGAFTRAILVDSAACECCRISLSTDHKGGVNVVFRDLLPGSVRDISIVRSEDNGLTFSRTASFSKDHWVVEGCPDNGPAVTGNANGTYAAWYAGSSANKSGGLFYAVVDGNNNTTKRLLTPDGKFIQLCLMPDGTRIAGYNESYRENDSIYNRIVIGKIDNNGYFYKVATPPGSRGFYPVVASAGKEQVIIAWKDNKRVFYRAVAVAEINTELVEKGFELSKWSNDAGRKVEVSNDTDPACGMKLIGQMARDTVMKEGNIIGFCSPKCRKKYTEAL